MELMGQPYHCPNLAGDLGESGHRDTGQSVGCGDGDG